MAIGYPLCPEATVEQIVSCIEQSLIYILKYAQKTSSKIFLCGHSAGAHLASSMLLIDWYKKYKLSNTLFGGFFLISGIYDLIPLVDTYVNLPLKMTQDSALKLSPLLSDSELFCCDFKHLPIVCVSAGDEATPFQEQNEQFGMKLQQMGFTKCEILKLQNRDHFDIIEELRTNDDILTRKLIDIMDESVIEH